MKAVLTNHKQSPRKVRLLADLIRGKKVGEAITILNFTAKKSSEQMIKVLNSAVTNAVFNNGAERSNLFIKEIRINKGLVIKRFMPRARGRATPIRHRSSHIHIVLGEIEKKPDLKTAKEDVKPKVIRKTITKKEIINKTITKKTEAKKVANKK